MKRTTFEIFLNSEKLGNCFTTDYTYIGEKLVVKETNNQHDRPLLQHDRPLLQHDRPLLQHDRHTVSKKNESADIGGIFDLLS